MNEKKLTPLEAYGLFLDDVEHCVQSGGCYSVQYKYKEIIKKALTALEIIKEKNVWFWVFRKTHNVKEYNEKIAFYYSPCDSLTEEEYDILKEVLL